MAAPSQMKVLVVGGGGREHALAWALAKSPSVREVLCAPGNAGIESVARCVPVKADEIVEAGRARRRREAVDLVVVGPEAPLVAGLADLLRDRGHAVFGCSRAAAEIEGSKAFCQGAAWQRHARADGGVRRVLAGARGRAVHRRAVPAVASAWSSRPTGSPRARAWSSRAARARPRRRCSAMLAGETVGDAGRRVVVEEFLVGREASLMALVDGERVTPLVPVRGSQARCATATRADDRRHGRGLADAGDERPRGRARGARGARADGARPGRRGPHASAACSTPG